MERRLAHWTDCPEAVWVQVQLFTDRVVQLLGDNLVGIYLHGSLALGGFNPQRSDIDLLVVTHHALSPGEKRAAAETVLRLSGSPRPMELSFLRESDLHPWRFPTPFDFHYSEDWREKTRLELDSGAYQQWPETHGGDPDLAAHVTVTRHCGIVLAGKAIADVFPCVPHQHYLASILGDVEDAPGHVMENPVYHVLNPCRVYWYLLEGQISSKAGAGAWALDHLPEEYRPVVRQALNTYLGESDPHSFGEGALHRFVAYILQQIRTLADGDGKLEAIDG